MFFFVIRLIFYIIIAYIRQDNPFFNYYIFSTRFLNLLKEILVEKFWIEVNLLKLRKNVFQYNWKINITPRIDRLGVFLNDNLIKYDAPELLTRTISYIFLCRKFTFWFVVTSIVVGFVFSWQTTYLMYFCTYFALKFEDQLLDLL